MTDRELLESIVNEIKSMKDEFKEKMSGIEQDIKLIKTQQSEHGEILTALREASEIHTAKLDSLEIGLAKLSGQQQESFQALADMYGQHELEISKLRRKSS